MTEFKLPELGENIHQGDLVPLMVAPGATVSEGEPVMELETDKAVVEVPSSVSGTVKDVLVKQGEKIKVGQVIFTVENGAGGVARAPSPSSPALPRSRMRNSLLARMDRMITSARPFRRPCNRRAGPKSRRCLLIRQDPRQSPLLACP